jgi:signal transduction histidine kinase
MITACIALINLIAIFYAEINHLMPFKQDANAINFEAKMVNLLSVFVILIIIVFFVTKKDLYEEEIKQEKDENINTLENELDKRLKEIAKLRSNIARDFHDTMGNKLASISSLSQMLYMKSNLSQDDIKKEVLKINTLSNEVYGGTKDFIWALNIHRNNLFEVYFYIRDFGEKLFESSEIDFISYPIDEIYEQEEISITSCSQLILIMKEAMTNALVHSNAQSVHLNLSKKENSICFEFSDDGIGFNLTDLKRINGLDNIQTRAKEIGLKLEILSELNRGTKVNILL